jgi:hypothetical protein
MIAERVVSHARLHLICPATPRSSLASPTGFVSWIRQIRHTLTDKQDDAQRREWGLCCLPAGEQERPASNLARAMGTGSSLARHPASFVSWPFAVY